MGTFNDLQMMTTSEFALQSLHAKIAPIMDFSHSFRELEDRVGAAVVVPSFTLTDAAEFNASTNNYFSGTKDVVGETINLDSHLVKSCMYTDRDVVETDVQFARDYGIGIGDCIGRAIYNKVIGLLNDTNVTKTATIAGTAKVNFADLFATVYDNNLDIDQTVLMLTPEMFAKLLGTLDANVYGGDEAIRGGRIPGLYGFKSVVCTPGLASEWKGCLADVNSIGCAARYLAPMTGAYVNAWQESDESSGMPIGFREGCDLATGYRYIAGEVLFGAKIIRPTGLVSLK